MATLLSRAEKREHPTMATAVRFGQDTKAGHHMSTVGGGGGGGGGGTQTEFHPVSLVVTGLFLFGSAWIVAKGWRAGQRA